MKITRRFLKFFGGNWGKPNKVEKKVNLPDPVFPEGVRSIPSKKHKKKKIRKIYGGYLCPFCDHELPLDEERIKQEEIKRSGRSLWFWKDSYRVTTCPNCGCYEVTECPACKSKTWFNPKKRTYKHNHIHSSCGFFGQKKEMP